MKTRLHKFLILPNSKFTKDDVIDTLANDIYVKYIGLIPLGQKATMIDKSHNLIVPSNLKLILC